MTDDRDLQALYAQLVESRGEDRRDCLDAERLMRLAEGSAPEPERLSGFAHVATCRRCQKELAMCRAVAEAGRTGGARHGRPALALAASLALLAAGSTFIYWADRNPRPDIMRGAPVAVTSVRPSGPVTDREARILTWLPAGAVRRYEVEVLDSTGALVFSATAIDTSLALPASVSLEPGMPYAWRVTAVLANGARRPSPATTFRVRP